MSIIDDVILIVSHILIPPSLHGEICKILLSPHQETSAMTERAKATVFWLGISTCINNTREQCDTWWEMAPSKPHVPPGKPFVPSYPFKAKAADYFDLAGHHYLITVDCFSNWPEVLKINPGSNNSAVARLMHALKRYFYFARFGLTEKVISGSGPQFIGKITNFLQRWGVKHHFSSAYNSQSNDRAKVAIGFIKRFLTIKYLLKHYMLKHHRLFTILQHPRYRNWYITSRHHFWEAIDRCTTNKTQVTGL